MQFGEKGELPAAFVGVALSGGGSRAANFSAAVLQNLDEMGLLKHVTAISSISGGGLTGGYYALHGPDIDWLETRSLLATDFLGLWIAKNLYPQNLVTLTTTPEDRSDLMSDVFDQVLFHGATFGNLGKQGPKRPRWIANATNIGTGNRFPFVEENFKGFLQSRLDTFPISYAVMASAAFPGVFNDVTLRHYGGSPSYTHLIDGGPSDNLGVESLLQAVSAYQQQVFNRSNGRGDPAPCFIFIVDAYPEPGRNPNGSKADVRGLIDYFVDTNFMDAFDVLLSRRRLDMLQRIGMGPASAQGGRTAPRSYEEARMADEGMTYFSPNMSVTSFDYPIGHTGYVWRGMIGGDMEAMKSSNENGNSQPSKGHFRCMVWHINLSASSETAMYVGGASETPKAIHGTSAFFSPLGTRRRALDKLVARVKTNFRLTGPANCSSENIQNALYAAAKALTRQDYESVQAACDWFKLAGLTIDERCRYFPGSDVEVSDAVVSQCLSE